MFFGQAIKVNQNGVFFSKIVQRRKCFQLRMGVKLGLTNLGKSV